MLGDIYSTMYIQVLVLLQKLPENILGCQAWKQNGYFSYNLPRPLISKVEELHVDTADEK